MDRRTRRHCRRLATAFDTDRVQRALVRARVNPVSAEVVKGRLRRSGRTGEPLVSPNEPMAFVALIRRVLEAASTVYPREVANLRHHLPPHETPS